MVFFINISTNVNVFPSFSRSRAVVSVKVFFYEFMLIVLLNDNVK